MPVLNPASAEPATSGLRELVDAAPVWIATSLRAAAEAGPLAWSVPEFVEVSSDAHGAGRSARWAVTGSVR
jgi:hypothetical protein